MNKQIQKTSGAYVLFSEKNSEKPYGGGGGVDTIPPIPLVRPRVKDVFLSQNAPHILILHLVNSLLQKDKLDLKCKEFKSTNAARAFQFLSTGIYNQLVTYFLLLT